MKIEKTVKITISPKELDTIIKNHLKKSKIQLTHISYETDHHNDVTIHCSGVECEYESDVNYNRGYTIETDVE